MQSLASGLSFGKQKMKTYKTPENKLYAFELDGSQDHLIGDDMVQVSEVDADLIRATSIATTDEPSPLQQIAALEASSMLPRVAREFLIEGLEREAAIDSVSPAQLYATNIGYKRLKDLDGEIAALRDLL